MKKPKLLTWMLVALVLTWLSLLVPAQTSVTRAEVMGCEQHCTVVAAGFPKPFLRDGVISPVNSVAINPFVVLFLHLDEFVFINFLLSYIFWFVVTLVIMQLPRIRHP